MLWFQGCNLNCPECWNQASHPFEGAPTDGSDIVRRVLALHHAGEIEGLTFSGGEPMQQASSVFELIERLREADTTRAPRLRGNGTVQPARAGDTAAAIQSQSEAASIYRALRGERLRRTDCRSVDRGKRRGHNNRLPCPRMPRITFPHNSRQTRRGDHRRACPES